MNEPEQHLGSVDGKSIRSNHFSGFWERLKPLLQTQSFHLLAALAVAIAEACQGDVVLMHDGVFDLATGIYTPEQLRQARRL